MWEFIAPQHLIGNLSTNDLLVDEAFLNLSSTGATKTLFVYSVSDECVKCSASKWQEMVPGHWQIVKFSTYMDLRWFVLQEDVGPWAKPTRKSLATIDHPNVDQFGVYKLDCNDERCDFTEIITAVDKNISVLYALMLALFVAWMIYLFRKHIERSLLMITSSKDTFPDDCDDQPPSTTRSDAVGTDPEKLGNPSMFVEDKRNPRLRSLDVFRGLIVVIMVFCNAYGGGRYWWTAHTKWNGFGLADIVFPSLLFLMGVCVPLSLINQIAKSVPKRELVLRAMKRSAKLCLVGIVMNTFRGYSLETIRVMHELQRYGIAYFFVATMYILTVKPLLLADPAESGRFHSMFQDVRALGRQWLAALQVVALHLAIVYGVKVPGCKRGYVGPGGDHEWGRHRNCAGGVSGYIDSQVLGEPHLLEFYIYGNREAFEPIGLFGCMLTCVHVFLGVQCGVTILVFNNWKARIVRLLAWSILYGLLGGILCGFRIEDGPIPINKHLWSLSFVLVTASSSYLGLAVMYWLVDVKRWWSGNPMQWAGMNPILIHFMSCLARGMFPFHLRMGQMNTHFACLLESMSAAGMWLVVAWCLHAKQIYLKM